MRLSIRSGNEKQIRHPHTQHPLTVLSAIDWIVHAHLLKYGIVKHLQALDLQLSVDQPRGPARSSEKRASY